MSWKKANRHLKAKIFNRRLKIKVRKPISQYGLGVKAFAEQILDNSKLVGGVVYKAVADATSSLGSKPSHAFIDGAWRPI